jgi:Tol biopolymer transport system component
MRKGLRTLVLVGIVLLLAAPALCDPGLVNLTNDFPGDALPDWSPDGTRIAFFSERTQLGIWILDLGTMAMWNLIDSAAWPDWSPDGSRIAVSDFNYMGFLNADGSGLLVLAEGMCPSWSPNGARIAFEKQGDLWIINSNGSGLVQITAGPETDRRPSWSPDGSRIAFYSDRSGSWGLWTVAANGSDLRAVVERGIRGVEDITGKPAWTPDGTYIAYERPDNVWMIHPDGTGDMRLTSGDPLEAYIGSFSPDGSRFVFCGGSTAGYADIWAMNLTDITPSTPCPPQPPSTPYNQTFRQLTNWPDASHWSGSISVNYDGSRVAFASDANLTGHNSAGYREIFAAYGDGTGLLQLTTGTPGGRSGSPQISGDGKMVVFESNANLTGQNADGNSELFVVSFDGATLRQLTFTTSDYDYDSVTLSYDGRWACFMSNADLTGGNPQHSYQVFVARTDGTQLRQLTNEPDNYNEILDASLSPDGQWVAYFSNTDPLGLNPDRSIEVFLVNRDGSGLRQVTQNPDPTVWFALAGGMPSAMTWNGQTLVLVSIANPTGQNPDGNRELFIVNSDGTGLRQLTCDPDFDNGYYGGVLSYDGTVVGFSSYADLTGENPYHLNRAFIMRSDGTRLTQPGGPDGVSPGEMNGDGRHAVFSSTLDFTGGNPDGSEECFMVDLAFPGERKIAAISQQGTPSSAVTVPITLDDTDGVKGLQFDLTYDPAILTNAAAQKGALIAGNADWRLAYNVITPGHMRVIAYDTTKTGYLGPGSGTIAECTFTVSASATRGQVSFLDLRSPILSDSLGNPLLVDGVDGFFTVIAVHHFEFDEILDPQHGDPDNPLPFTITVRAMDQNDQPATLYNEFAHLTDLTGTLDVDLTTVQPDMTAAFSGGVFTGQVVIRQPTAPDYDRITAVDWLDPSATGVSNDFKVIGEANPNGDAEIKVGDVVMTVNLALDPTEGTPAERAAADVNNDGEVNVLDVIIIQNMALGVQGAGGPGGMAALQAAPSARAAGPVIAGGKPPTPGAKKIAVPVVIDRAQGVAGFQFDLAYDGSVLSPVEVRAGALIANKPDWLLNANLAANPLKVLCYSNQSRALSGGAGTLVEVIFAQTGKLAKDSLRLGTTVASDGGGNSLARTLSLGKTRALK